MGRLNLAAEHPSQRNGMGICGILNHDAAKPDVRQPLAIDRALVLEPKLLILDEPTEGIQPNIVHEIGNIVLRLNQQEGLTVLLVEQKLPFARRVASELCILDKGRRLA